MVWLVGFAMDFGKMDNEPGRRSDDVGATYSLKKVFLKLKSKLTKDLEVNM